MRYLVVFLLFLIQFLFENTARAQRDLAIVGSSTSACTGPTNPNNCYVLRLRTYYNVTPPNDTSIDNGYAVGGYSVFRGMPTGYVPASTDPAYQPDAGHNITAALASHPNVVLINYPTNGFDVIRLDSILLCFRIIRNTAIQAGVPCFITTTQPRTSGNFSSSIIKRKLADLKDSILNEYGYFAIDFYTQLINPADSSIRYDAGDGTHMNDIGHDSLARRVEAKNVFLATLPATFLQFNAAYKNNLNLVTWTTAQETNVSAYEIQRSSNGRDFSTIASVNPTNNPGNNTYSYSDQQFLKGQNYYRIVILDRDGNTHLSPVMNVYINTGKLAIVKAFATTAQQVIVQLENTDAQHADWQLLNNMGLLIMKGSGKIEAGNPTITINTPVLSNGIYHIQLSTKGESVIGSFIKN